ncbi:MAG: UDP-N-acetylmuramate dehydrogenase [Glaciecola sp.]|jgi:UDP-N-acetylmuramate dehydrogenase
MEKTTIQTDYNLKANNTFGIEVFAKKYTEIKDEDDFKSLINDGVLVNDTRLILGGGSNLLFTKNFDGIVIKNNIKGIEVLGENDDHVFVQAGAGETWHEFVLYCINQGWHGIENLSLIPGNVGASPMQNIGAYGVEIKDVFHELEAVHIASGETHYFDKNACEFGYRESVFKKEMKNQYLISSVSFKLSKKPSFSVEYGAIKQELEQMNVSELTAKNISNAVINIRSSKLPDPKKLGNAGSFFKNPVIDTDLYEQVKKEHENLVAYPAGEGKMKLAAGWLIDQAGWKGKVVGNCGVHDLQALVLVNHGGATGEEIYDLSSEVLQSVKEKFGVDLEREVNIY